MPGGAPGLPGAPGGSCRHMPGLPPKFPGGPLLPGLGGTGRRASADFPDWEEEMTISRRKRAHAPAVARRGRHAAGRDLPRHPLFGSAVRRSHQKELTRCTAPGHANRIELNTTKGKSNVSENPARPRGHQEAAGLSHRGRRQPLAARRPLHRAARLFQSAAAEGQDRAAQARPRQGQGLDRQGRAADRPRVALPRRGRRDEAREAQQSGEGDPAQGAQGARKKPSRPPPPPRLPRPPRLRKPPRPPLPAS